MSECKDCGNDKTLVCFYCRDEKDLSKVRNENTKLEEENKRLLEIIRVLKDECVRHRKDREWNGVIGMSVEMMAVNANHSIGVEIEKAMGYSYEDKE